jgi:hypothetical protein
LESNDLFAYIYFTYLQYPGTVAYIAITVPGSTITLYLQYCTEVPPGYVLLNSFTVAK